MHKYTPIIALIECRFRLEVPILHVVFFFVFILIELHNSKYDRFKRYRVDTNQKTRVLYYVDRITCHVCRNAYIFIAINLNEIIIVRHS